MENNYKAKIEQLIASGTISQEVAKKHFPELIENEDEKIRKMLIEYVRGSHPATFPWHGFEQKQILAWLEKQGNQKPALSEEDKENFKHLTDEIVCLGNNRDSSNRLYYDRLIKFIDDLKNRVQPKEKWRDKDERMLDRLIAYFENQVAFTDDDNPRYANWLKSIKDRFQLQPQSQWKPTNEQVEALETYLYNPQYISNSEDKRLNLVESLYKQLKKLRDE